ncbi:hypothetical protein [Paraburkholderia sp. DHOC27]|uniref:hypothetical protein n=1 Tax=Paraburkholderia sp. DHOC27 TaxID=2303330 RepID=UPI0011C0F0FD|nr:hypothetical protein [Paraburkholderia sp. DHOC27]
MKLEQEFLKQRTDLADAEGKPESKVKKTATEGRCIVTDKMEATRLAHLHRLLQPVLLMENDLGQRSLPSIHSQDQFGFPF